MTITKALGLPRGASGWAAWMATQTPAVWTRLADDSASALAEDATANNRDGNRSTLVCSAVPSLLVGDADAATAFAGTSSNGIQWASAAWMNVAFFTSAIVFSRSGTPAATETLINRWATDLANHRQFRVYLNTAGQVVFGIGNTAGTEFTVASTDNLCDGTAHLVVVRRIGTLGALWVDGVLIGTASQTGTTAGVSVGVQMSIGYNARNASMPLTGTLDEYAFWGVDLSDTAIDELHAAAIVYGESDSALSMTPGPPDTLTLGLATETGEAFAFGRQKTAALGLVEDFEEPLALTVTSTLNGGFVNRDDISLESGYLPITNLVQANTEAGEYTGGLAATLWWEWTASSYRTPGEVTLSFDYAGQSAGGGASLRVYDPVTPGTIPAVGEVVASDDASGAAGSLSVSFTPVAGTTYYIQAGIVEKAGTQTYLLLELDYATSPSFTPVIP